MSFGATIITFCMNERTFMIDTNLLRKLRNRYGFSQEYVADHLGMSQSGYRKIENGDTCIKLEHAVKLSRLFEIDVMEFVVQEKPLVSEQDQIERSVNESNTTNNLDFFTEVLTTKNELIKAKDELIAALRKELSERIP